MACHPFARASGLSHAAESCRSAGVTEKSLVLKWQTVAFSFSLNDHLEGKSTGVTGEERKPRSWAVCRPEGSIQECSPPNWAPSQPVWNPVTFLPASEWKRTPFILKSKDGVLSAVSLLSWPDCLLRKTIKSSFQLWPVWVWRAV